MCAPIFFGYGHVYKGSANNCQNSVFISPFLGKIAENAHHILSQKMRTIVVRDLHPYMHAKGLLGECNVNQMQV